MYVPHTHQTSMHLCVAFLCLNEQLKSSSADSLLATSPTQGHYESIRSAPFQYHHGVDELTEVFFNPDHEGYLIKEGESLLSLEHCYGNGCSCRRKTQELA